MVFAVLRTNWIRLKLPCNKISEERNSHLKVVYVKSVD